MKYNQKSKESSPSSDKKPKIRVTRHKRSLSDVFMTSKEKIIKEEEAYNLFSQVRPH